MERYKSPTTDEDRVLIKPSSVLNDIYDLIPEYRTHVEGNVALAKTALVRLGDRGEDVDFFLLCGDVGLLIPRLIDKSGVIYATTCRKLENLDIDLDSVIGVGLFYSQKMSGPILGHGFACSAKIRVDNHSFSVEEFVETLISLTDSRIWTFGY